MLEVRPPPVPDLPPITQTTFLTCRAQYPGGPNRCVSVSSLSARPSPFNGRVGIHNFTFEACSSFTRVTACKIACPPKGGLLSRGFDPASYPTKPLGSYHVLPTTTWMDPPSTGDLRRWGARRVEEGRWTGTYWQPVVSLPRSSNWTCSFRTSSFPTGFTAAPTRAVHTTWCRATAPRISRFALRHSGIERSSVLRGVVDSSSITALFPLSPAHQKQGSFPPPVLPSIHGTVTLSDFRTGHPPIEDVGGATSTSAGSPPITQTTFLTCRAQYPGGPNRCVSVSSLSARPSPFNGRVGIHNFTFEACSSFTRVTGRGRDSGYPLPPAQTRAGAASAHGSYLGCLASKRALGYGCSIWISGSWTASRSRKRSQVQRLR